MSLTDVIPQAQEFMERSGLQGWLIYDYRGMNPIFWDTVGPVSMVTRPCFLWIPAHGKARFVISYVDQGRFSHLGIQTTVFVSRDEMIKRLGELLEGGKRIAMEYTPQGALPRVSRVDAGTISMVRSLGVEVVSSADLLQYATQRWSPAQLHSHTSAATKLNQIVQEAFQYIGENLVSHPTEYAVAQLIRRRFKATGLTVDDGPVVAFNRHTSDPHYEPRPDSSSPIQPGDWVLIDLWARDEGEDTMFGDITWVAYIGDRVPERHQRIFQAVIEARDEALEFLDKALREGRTVQGWEVDRVARDYISKSGYGDYFRHRLGHSLGREVHSNAVNLDAWETIDTRQVIPGRGVTIEPGIYLPEFGVRSEIDVYISEEGTQVTTEVQREVALIT